ncbi:heavy-metal-associated domain-containing protein [Flavobacteriaceae bacterium]|nr:heavy-metal-associated domain-containing protein [Flavobacteriaceae bacterium]MDA9372540.1 heavy-metal-associated domain-containing protein [Flavobacteriaceae bacterium]
MTQTYHIQGMTCNGCKDSVTRAFQSLEGVYQVHVDLEKGTALLTTASVIQTKLLKEVLPSKFTLIESNTQTVKQNNVFARDKKAPQGSKLEQLKPLFLIFGFLLLISSALNFRGFTTLDFMLDFMGLFFFVFSLFKFLDLSGFALSFAMYDPLAKRLPLYGRVYPFLELILGFLLLAKLQLPIALLVTVILLSITTIGVCVVLLQKKQITCACLGTVLKLPMTQATFIENSVMIFMATFILLTHYI